MKWPDPVFAPYSITQEITRALCSRYDVRLYDWNEQVSVKAGSEDIVVVHPKVDARYLDASGNPIQMDESSVAWKILVENPGVRRIVCMPYVPPWDDPWLHKVLPHTSYEFIAICGATWTKDFALSSVGQSVKKFLRLDMCIDPSSYPLVKERFNPPGTRKFLYVGHTSPYKNTQMLEALAASVPGFEGGHIGYGEVRGWRKLGEGIAFTPAIMRQLAAEYDLFLTVSSGDAQATTVLEQCCFGLVIGSTPETGYELPGTYRLHVSDLAENVRVISEMQAASSDELLARARTARDYVVREHTWGKLSAKVLGFLG